MELPEDGVSDAETRRSDIRLFVFIIVCANGCICWCREHFEFSQNSRNK
jgi:hypothetical protein